MSKLVNQSEQNLAAVPGNIPRPQFWRTSWEMMVHQVKGKHPFPHIKLQQLSLYKYIYWQDMTILLQLSWILRDNLHCEDMFQMNMTTDNDNLSYSIFSITHTHTKTLETEMVIWQMSDNVQQPKKLATDMVVV